LSGVLLVVLIALAGCGGAATPPVVQTPVGVENEEAPAEDTNAEEAPAEDTTAEEAPAEDTTNEDAEATEAEDAPAATLTGYAVLPAATFAEGPPSGTVLGSEPINGQPVPFEEQPVQGFSAIINNGDGTYWVLSDNGFGSIESSADYHLRLYNIRPDFKTTEGGSGSIEVIEHIELRDPDQHIPFAITNHFSDERILTGADFDIESVQRAPDGTLWIGDEFGPFLLHFDETGVLLEEPFPLPNFDDPDQKPLCAPQNPSLEEASGMRVMNAARFHARAQGNMRMPVFSPWSALLDDGNEATAVDTRVDPPEGVEPASSEIFNINAGIGMQANDIERAGYPVVVWTVNDKDEMLALMELGVEGIISDRPDLLLEAVQEFDGDEDGSPDYLTDEGLIDITLFDAQGHRGGRNLRPENTLPAMEVALDNLMTTLELDLGITSDGVPMLGHDPEIQTTKCRYADDSPYEEALLKKDLTASEIQEQFICDVLLEGRDAQENNPDLSPVAVAFAEAEGLPHPYTMPTLQHVLDFVDFYVTYYRDGEGQDDPQAELRAANAEQVRYNIETKVNPRVEQGYAERTIEPEPFARAVADVVVANDMQERMDIQSFDFRTLLVVQEEYPEILTVYLFGDWPIEIDDGTNLQPDDSGNSPWLASIPWPYRVNRDTYCSGGAFQVNASGGFEGMALSPDGTKLYPLLEKPLAGSEENVLLIHEFDLESKQYTGVQYMYPMNERGEAIGDFIMYNDEEGLVIERDNSQGDLEGFKAIYKIRMSEPGTMVEKTLLVDLLNISDPNGLAGPGDEGDVGLGEQFAFPFITIEDVFVADENHIGVLNDNNYPFSIGRHVGTEMPDDTEFILVEVDETLEVAQ
jgi:glycerophosphoryl diester phosphodiesterase